MLSTGRSRSRSSSLLHRQLLSRPLLPSRGSLLRVFLPFVLVDDDLFCLLGAKSKQKRGERLFSVKE